MNIEIERKFLVKGDFEKYAVNQKIIKQGYLSTVPERLVRIRIYGNKGYLTIKGIPNSSGTSRFEWEKEISADEASELLNLCEPGIIEKIRYYVPFGNHTFEVDEFFGDNSGLIVAEIELRSEDEHFDKPDWLGDEVTHDKKYNNSMLTKNPFKNWQIES